MTADTADTLTGRELDAAIHRLLGNRCRFIEQDLEGVGYFTADREFLDNDWIDEETSLRLAAYSSDKTPAMLLVLAWLREQVLEIEMRYYHKGWHFDEAKVGWIVNLYRISDDPDDSWISATGDTLPEAVCRCALKAGLARQSIPDKVLDAMLNLGEMDRQREEGR